MVVLAQRRSAMNMPGDTDQAASAGDGDFSGLQDSGEDAETNQEASGATPVRRSVAVSSTQQGAAQAAQQTDAVNAPDVVMVQHLVKRYGHRIAVDDVSFSIHEGEI